ncbi:MAG: hypothetical protein AB8B55_05225 [Mariniblastus sp.]
MHRLIHSSIFALTIAIFLVPVSPHLPSQALAQEEKNELSDMELIEKVGFLQNELESAEIPKRDAAEKELIELGVRVLDYLEPTTDKTTSDATARISRIRLALEKIAVASVTEASKIKLVGKMTVGEALKRIRKQSKNDVAMPEETPDIFAVREIELKLDGVPFWVALNDVMRKSDLVVDLYGGGPGILRLVPTDEARMRAADPAAAEADKAKKDKKTGPPRNVSGIFDLTVTQVNASRNLANPELNYCNIRIKVRWEPRVTPISIDLPSTSIKAIDEFDSEIEITNRDAVLSGTVQPEIPELEFSIPIGLVDRQIESIASLDATIDAVLPGRMETFRFKKLGRLSPGANQTKAGATVTFEGIAKNEDLYGVTVGLSFDEEHNALESHQSWVYRNPVFMENKEGERFEVLTYHAVRQRDNEIAIEYFFEHDPKDMTLNYKTPAAIVEVPVKVSLKDIPLP